MSDLEPLKRFIEEDDTVLPDAVRANPAPGGLPSDAASAARDPANVCGKFVQIERIGRGAMGSVWRCYDRELGRYVAVKLLERGDDACAARFAREAKVVARLEHPNIARVYEVTAWRGQPAIVMQLVDGKPLAAVRVSVRDGVDIMAKVARAIHHAHEHGVLHRDVKPGNIMLDGRRQPFVLDFGLAREQSKDASLSATGAVLGTPAYMSPEQARGDVHRTDARSDVYGLGATLYEVVTGRPPFDGASAFGILAQVLMDDAARPSRLRPEIPWELDTIIFKAIEKEPARRYQSAQELAAELERFLRGEPIRARPSSMLYRMRKRIRRQPVVFGGLGVAALTALLAGAFLLGSHTQRRRELAALLADGRRHLDAGELRAAHEAAVKARAIDDDAAGELFRSVEREMAADRERRASLEAREAERAAVEPLLRRLWRIDLAGGTSDVGEVQPILDDSRALAELHTDWAGASLALGWAKRLRFVYGGGAELLESARADLDRAVERASDLHRADALYQRGMLYAERVRHRLGEAAPGLSTDGKSMEVSWRIDLPDDPESRDWIARALADLRARTDVEINDVGKAYGEALVLYLEGRYEPAAQLLRTARVATIDGRLLLAHCLYHGRRDVSMADEVERLALATMRRDALTLAGWMHITSGAWPRAEQVLGRWCEAAPGPLPFCYRGMARWGARRYADAVADFSRAIERAPGWAEGYLCRGAARLGMDDVDGALQDLTRAIEIDPSSAALGNRADAHFRKGDREAAIRDLVRAVERDSASLLARRNLAVMRRRMEDYDKAIADFTWIIERAPSARAYVDRAEARRGKRDFAGAIEDVSRAIELEPANAMLRCELGVARHESGDLEGAFAEYSRAIELDPKSAVAHDLRGRYHADRKKHDLAIADYTKAIELMPGWWQPRFNRAVSRQRKGDFRGAIADYEKAIELDPKNHLARANCGETRVGLALFLPRDEALPQLRKAQEELERALAEAPADWAQRGLAEQFLDACRKRIAQLGP